MLNMGDAECGRCETVPAQPETDDAFAFASALNQGRMQDGAAVADVAAFVKLSTLWVVVTLRSYFDGLIPVQQPLRENLFL